MSIIYSYPEQGALNANDLLIGTSAEKVGGKQKNTTRSFSIQQIADFINSGTGFVDPIASDFQIPVFNQEGKKITGSIMSQNSSPSNGVAGSTITIAGSLETTGDLTSPGVVTIGGGTNLITLNSETYLKGSLRDSANVLGADKQILLSDQFGYTTWTNYEAGLTYEGTWDANANTTNGLSNSPALVPGVGVSGHFYIVNVEGTTSLGPGLGDWHVGDWAVFLDEGGQPASWQKIDNTSVLTGSGTDGVFAKWTDATTINDSLMSQVGTEVVINGELKVKDTIQATTADTNLKLKGNGTGGVQVISADGITDGKITLNCSQNSHGVTLQSPPHASSAAYTLVLPNNVGGAGDVLTSAGVNPSQLVWTTPTTGTVTSVGLSTDVTAFTVGASPITSSGVLTLNKNGGTAGQYIDGDTGSWVDLPSGDTYTLSAGAKSGASVPLNLDAAAGADSVVNLTEGTGITLTRTSATEVTIAGSAQGVTGSGTVNKLPKFDTATSLTDSILSEIASGFGTSNMIMLPQFGILTGFRANANVDGFPPQYGVLTSVDLSSDPFGVSNLTQLANFSFRFNSTSDADVFRSKYGFPAGQSGFDSTSFASETTFVFNYSSGATITFTHPSGVIAFNNEDEIVLGKGFGELPGPTSYGQELSYVSGAGTITETPTTTQLNSLPSIRVDGIIDMFTNQIKNVVNPTDQQDAATKQYVDTAVSGALTFQGTFDASTGTILSGANTGLQLYSGASGGIAINKGDFYIASVAGSFYNTTALNAGDEAIALNTVAAGSSTVSDWSVVPAQSAGVTGSGLGRSVSFFTGAIGAASSDISSDSNIVIDSNSNLGIGTNNPQVKLHASTNVDEVLRLNSSTSSQKIKFTNSGNTTDDSEFGSANGDLAMYTNNNGTANTQSFTFNKDGYLGIGSMATSPTFNVDIQELLFDPNMRLYGSNTGSELRFQVSNSFGNFNTSINSIQNDLNFLGNSTNLMTLGVANNLGSLKLSKYGQGNKLGEVAYNLAVNFEGDIVEAAPSSGASTITTNQTTTTNSTTTVFALGATPSGGSRDFVDVFIDGVYQEVSTYTVTGTTNITFTAALPLGVTVETKTTSANVSGALVSSVDIGQSTGNTGGVNLRRTIFPTTGGVTTLGVANSLYIFTATGASSISTVNLPASPTLGDSVKISNLGGLANVLGANGNKIMGVAADLTINTPTAAFELIWSGLDNGWIIIGNV